MASAVEDAIAVPFSELQGFPRPTVAGHEGRFVLGRIGGIPVVAQAGRFHYYEGVTSEVVAAPIRTAHAAGARIVVLSNAAGGIRSDLRPGSLMLIDDHLALAFRSPLAGPPRQNEARFPDMSRPYDPQFLATAEKVALQRGVPLSRGTYGMVLGPSYETPAEIRAMRAAGADAVGMSTIPEVTVARALGHRLLAFSVITNFASGLGPDDLSHEEVELWGERAGQLLTGLLAQLLPSLAESG